MWRLYGELAVLLSLAFLVGAALAWGLASLLFKREDDVVSPPHDRGVVP